MDVSNSRPCVNIAWERLISPPESSWQMMLRIKGEATCAMVLPSFGTDDRTG